MYDTIVKWRSDFIRFEIEDHSFIIKDKWFYFVDDKTGVRLMLGSSSGQFSISEETARQAYNSERMKVMNNFTTELNMIVLPSQKWQYFDSTVYPIPYEPEKRLQFTFSGPFGRGRSYQQKDFDDTELFKNNGRPSKILVRSGDRVDAI